MSFTPNKRPAQEDDSSSPSFWQRMNPFSATKRRKVDVVDAGINSTQSFPTTRWKQDDPLSLSLSAVASPPAAAAEFPTTRTTPPTVTTMATQQPKTTPSSSLNNNGTAAAAAPASSSSYKSPWKTSFNNTTTRNSSSSSHRPIVSQTNSLLIRHGHRRRRRRTYQPNSKFLVQSRTTKQSDNTKFDVELVKRIMEESVKNFPSTQTSSNSGSFASYKAIQGKRRLGTNQSSSRLSSANNDNMGVVSFAVTEEKEETVAVENEQERTGSSNKRVTFQQQQTQGITPHREGKTFARIGTPKMMVKQTSEQSVGSSTTSATTMLDPMPPLERKIYDATNVQFGIATEDEELVVSEYVASTAEQLLPDNMPVQPMACSTRVPTFEPEQEDTQTTKSNNEDDGSTIPSEVTSPKNDEPSAKRGKISNEGWAGCFQGQNDVFNQWQCPQCLSHNPYSAKDCLSCGAPRPPTTAAANGGGEATTTNNSNAAASASSSSTGGSIGANGFTFGVAKTETTSASSDKSNSSNGISFGFPKTNDTSASERKNETPPAAAAASGFQFGTDNSNNKDTKKSTTGFQFPTKATKSTGFQFPAKEPQPFKFPKPAKTDEKKTDDAAKPISFGFPPAKDDSSDERKKRPRGDTNNEAPPTNGSGTPKFSFPNLPNAAATTPSTTFGTGASVTKTGAAPSLSFDTGAAPERKEQESKAAAPAPFSFGTGATTKVTETAPENKAPDNAADSTREGSAMSIGSAISDNAKSDNGTAAAAAAATTAPAPAAANKPAFVFGQSNSAAGAPGGFQFNTGTTNANAEKNNKSGFSFPSAAPGGTKEPPFVFGANKTPAPPPAATPAPSLPFKGTPAATTPAAPSFGTTNSSTTQPKAATGFSFPSTNPAPAAAPGFGTSAPGTSSTPAFTFGAGGASNAAATPGFGTAATPGFGAGAAATPGFGGGAAPPAAAATTPNFGAGPSFGTAPTQPQSSFAATAPSFGTNPPAATATPAAPSFGTNPSAATPAAPPPANIFGSQQPPPPQQQQPFGANAPPPAAAGPFGAASSFGTTAPAAAAAAAAAAPTFQGFGSSTGQPQPPSGGFNPAAAAAANGMPTFSMGTGGGKSDKRGRRIVRARRPPGYTGR